MILFRPRSSSSSPNGFQQVVKLRLICKQWSQIIDENRSFWQIVEVPRGTIEDSHSTLNLFDQRSPSTLKEISLNLLRKNPTFVASESEEELEERLGTEQEQERTNFINLVTTLQKSSSTLQALTFTDFKELWRLVRR